MLINSPEHACSCSAGAKRRPDNETTASKTNAALMLSLSDNQRIRTAEFIYANKRERVCSLSHPGPWVGLREMQQHLRRFGPIIESLGHRGLKVAFPL